METKFFDSDENRAFLKKLGPPTQDVPVVNRIWYHGTTKNRLYEIKRDGFFREGTWFARHMEDAREFGGSVILKVNIFFDVYESEWQVCTKNAISVSAIIDTFTVHRKMRGKKNEK